MKLFQSVDSEPCPRPNESESLGGEIWASVFKEYILMYVQDLELLFVFFKNIAHLLLGFVLLNLLLVP